MYILLIIIHIIICIFLILTILLQAGRGGGLTESVSSPESMQSVLGSQAPIILKRATEFSAIAFLVTSLALGMITAQRGRSLFERSVMPVGPVMPMRDVAPVSVPESNSGTQQVPATNAVPAAQEAQQTTTEQ